MASGTAFKRTIVQALRFFIRLIIDGVAYRSAPSLNNCTSSGNRSIVISDEVEIDRWVSTLNHCSVYDIVSRLTSSEGYDIYLSVLNHPRLCHANFHELVRLLSRPELRSSPLTDKIYNALSGSCFTKVMHSQIRGNRQPTFDSLEPFVSLCEELMSRTCEGWKDVPLDELKDLVDEVQNHSVAGLNNILTRLLDSRAEKKRLAAEDGIAEQYSPVSNFRDMPIIPLKEQIFTSKDSNQLPVNLLGLRFTNIGVYLDTHFRLMQEDCIASLRDGIRELRKALKVKANINVYTNVRLLDLRFCQQGKVFQVSFNSNTRQPIDWQSAKRLMIGSLLCMSCDKFRTLLWVVVANRQEEQLHKNEVGIQIVQSSERMELMPNYTYVMAESGAAYFEPYSHVLRNLQRPEMDKLPFQEHFIALEPHVKEPAYLKERRQKDVYDFEGVFPEIREALGTTQFHTLQIWPTWQSCLDKSQMSAVQHGLTKRLALIQGPPGTGKTFIGLLIVRLLLANLNRATSSSVRGSWPKQTNISQEENTVGRPILIICYTNHALDQFLEGLYAHEKRIVRVGGGSNSSLLQDCNLKALKWQGWTLSLLGEQKRVSIQKKRLERQISKFSYLLTLDHVTKEILNEIATAQQINSLFYDGCKFQDVVKMWLSEHDKRHSNADCLNPVQPSQTSSQNRSGVLESVNDLDALGEDSATVKLSDAVVIEDSETGTTAPEIAAQANKRAGFNPADLGWTHVKQSCLKSNIYEHGREEREGQKENLPLEERMELLRKQADVWALDGEDRWALHTFWMNRFCQVAKENLSRLDIEYAKTCQRSQEIQNKVMVGVLRKAAVVGMTSTGAAKYHSVLELVQPEIVMVEEAAEVLESHIVASLTASTKHLILIGDHQQLRPLVAVHKLAVKHKLDVSLFERLIEGGVEYVTLEVQRRMRPSISKLLSSIYPMLKDHQSVSSRENIKGLKSNVFFLYHNFPEDHKDDDQSEKRNVMEAQFVAELYAYLLRQQYSDDDITILSMYRGQTQEICRQLAQKLQARGGNSLQRVRTVDQYQGEECKIIILSLVRNNMLPTASTPGQIGFLAVANRMCVAISRARDGLFMFGNGTLLSEKSKLWKDVVKNLQQSDSYGDALVLTCQNHPNWQMKIRHPSDFQYVPDGGCGKSCDYQLDCGHECPKLCHSGGHDEIVCPKRCSRKHLLCDHQCQMPCHGFNDCTPCQIIVKKILPKCGHCITIPCCKRTESVACPIPCAKVLICSHACQRKCGETCTILCNEMVERDLPCGHQARLACHVVPSTFLCPHPCR